MGTRLNFSSLIIIAGILTVISTSCEKDIPLTGIQLDQVTANVMVGATLNLNVVFSPLDASNQNLTWETDNESVATVANGVVTGVALGTATIKAISNENSTLEATCAITVIPSTGQQIIVTGDITTDTKWYANARYFISE